MKKRSKRKSVTEQLFFSAVAVFACILHKTGGSHAGRPFFMSWAGCTGNVLASVNPLSRAVFHFFSSRKAMGASSLSFENRSKENQLRNSCFSLPLLFSPAYCTKRAVPMRAVRFLCHGQDAPGTCLLPSIPCPALSFISFLQERPWALLPYHLKIEAKKISYGTAVFLCRCCFRLHIAQNGRFPCGPSVFYVMGRMHRERACFRQSPVPRCLSFLFFKKRKRPPSLNEGGGHQ